MLRKYVTFTVALLLPNTLLATFTPKIASAAIRANAVWQEECARELTQLVMAWLVICVPHALKLTGTLPAARKSVGKVSHPSASALAVHGADKMPPAQYYNSGPPMQACGSETFCCIANSTDTNCCTSGDARYLIENNFAMTPQNSTSTPLPFQIVNAHDFNTGPSANASAVTAVQKVATAGGLSFTAKVGIAVGAATLIVLMIFFVFVCLRSQRRRKLTTTAGQLRRRTQFYPLALQAVPNDVQGKAMAELAHVEMVQEAPGTQIPWELDAGDVQEPPPTKNNRGGRTFLLRYVRS